MARSSSEWPSLSPGSSPLFGLLVPAYLLRDRDRVYGQQFRRRLQGMGIEEVLTAPQSPWQNPFAERLIGSIRGECLNHVLVLGERHLRRILIRYLLYYHQARTHLALDKDAPDLRPIELPLEERSCSFPKSAACTTATSAKPHSPASSVVCVPKTGVTGPRVACSLSVTHRESARTVHGRRSEHPDRPVPNPPRGRGAWSRMVMSESDEVLAKHRRLRGRDAIRQRKLRLVGSQAAFRRYASIIRPLILPRPAGSRLDRQGGSIGNPLRGKRSAAATARR